MFTEVSYDLIERFNQIKFLLDSTMKVSYHGIPLWSAREMAPILGYHHNTESIDDLFDTPHQVSNNSSGGGRVVNPMIELL